MALGDQFNGLEYEPRMPVGEWETETVENMKKRQFDVTRGSHGTAWHPDMKEVLPGEVVGKTNFESTSRVNRAYYTAHSQSNPSMAEQEGWRWARTAAGRSIEKDPEPHAVAPGVRVPRRPVVHDVEAVGQIAGDPVLNPRGTTDVQLTADKLNVKDTHWIPPVSSWNSSVVGNQGTLPHHNWNRWGDPNNYLGEHNVQEITQKRQFRIRQSEDRPRSKPEIPGQLPLL